MGVLVNDVATLVTAIGFLVTALGTAAASVITALRSSKRERRGTAQKTAQKFVERLLDAAEDGEITPEEMAKITKALKGTRKAGDE